MRTQTFCNLFVFLPLLASGVIGKQVLLSNIVSDKVASIRVVPHSSTRAGQRGRAEDFLRNTLRSFVWMQIEHIGQPSSSSGKNSGNFDSYTFNDAFNGTKCTIKGNGETIFNESSGLDLQEVKQKLYDLEMGALNGTLSPQNYTDWKPFASQLLLSFRTEEAAIAYDENRQLWIICGWVRLCTTFVNKPAMTRMCSAMAAIGLDSPSRVPLEGRDYTSKYARPQNQSESKGGATTNFSPQITRSITYNPSHSTTIYLFTNADASCGEFHENINMPKSSVRSFQIYGLCQN